MLLFFMVLILLTACGQKGPLYLPEEPVQEIQSDKPSADASATVSDQE